MRTCPICNALLEDDSKFCTHCGTKVEGVVTTQPNCPNCHAPIEDGATFCVYCGTKINTTSTNNAESAKTQEISEEEKLKQKAAEEERRKKEEEKKLASLESLKEYAQNKRAEYERDKKERNKFLLWGFISLLIIGVVGGALFFMRDKRNDKEIEQPVNLIESESIVKEENNDDNINIEELKADVRIALGKTLITRDYLILTFKDDYEATEIASEYADTTDLMKYTFDKGEIICNSDGLGRLVERNGSDGFNVSCLQLGEFYVPKDIVSVKTEQVGCIDLSILDKAVLHFKSDDDRTCTMYKLKQNGKTVSCDDGRIPSGNLYCLETDTRFITLLTCANTDPDAYRGMNDCKSYDNEERDIDREHTLTKNIEFHYSYRVPSVFYIPSKKSLLCDGKMYKLTDIEPIK